MVNEDIKMTFKSEIQLYKIIKYLNKRRKRQLIALFVLLILSGLLEAFSIASAIPFLSLLSNPDYFFGLSIVQKISNFLKIDSNGFFYFATILFCIFILLSTAIRLFNAWFIIFITMSYNFKYCLITIMIIIIILFIYWEIVVHVN